MTPRGGLGHFFPGIFTLSLPFALAVLWLYEELVRVPTIQLMPRGLRIRLQAKSGSHSFRDFSAFTWAVISTLLGIATHILWDSFTHISMWPYHHWTFLREQVRLPIFGVFPWYKVLQFGSSIIGIAILSLWFVRWYRRSEPMSEEEEQGISAGRRMLIWTITMAVALAGSGMRVAFGRGMAGRGHLPTFVGQAVVTFIAVLWWEAVAYGFFQRVRSQST